MNRRVTNVGASVRARLLAMSRTKGLNFDLLLIRYAIERLLYRLSQSRHAKRFVLKGATLLTAWFDEPIRGTRDLDLLGYGDSDPDSILEAFREVLDQERPDGVQFDAVGARISRIRERDEYGGLRMRTNAEIGGARIAVSVDIGFGDATEPPPRMLELPVLLDQPAPRMRGYARETVIAEKFHAMVEYGATNSRLKDYYDLWALGQSGQFDDARLARAVSATFTQRNTALPVEMPDALTREFFENPVAQRLWNRFKRDVSLDPGSLADAVEAIAAFLMPVAIAARAIGCAEEDRAERAD